MKQHFFDTWKIPRAFDILEFESVNGSGRRHLRHPWKWNQGRASKDGFTASSPLQQ